MDRTASSRRTRGTQLDQDVDALLAACRLLVAVNVRSLATVADAVDLTQLRILVVLASREGTTLGQLATATGLHPSRASRTCDRLVRLGLIYRVDHPDDRRSLQLTLTEQGREIVATVAQARRDALTPVVRRLAPARRRELIEALDEFTAVGGEPDEAHLWRLGWATSAH